MPGRQMAGSGNTGSNRPNHHQQGPPGGNSRSQGPPPPYHQTQRSASVPIATQSPNPGSPNNPTSNLSLPSPRDAGSTLNSPAADHGMTQPSLATPGGGGGNGPASVPTSGQSQNQVANNRQLPYKQDSPANNAANTPTSSAGPAPSATRSLSQHNSNPSTPISSHLSPNASLKDLDLGNSQGK